MNPLHRIGQHIVQGSSKGANQPRFALAGQMAMSGANFATTLIIVRSLGLEEFGRFSLCYLLAMIVRNFLNGVVLMPMSTLGPKLSKPAQSRYRGFLAAHCFAFSLGSSLLLFMLALPLSGLLNAPWLPNLALALALSNFAANGADFVRRYHFAQNKPIWAFGVDAIRFSAQIGILLGIALIWKESFCATSALYTLAVSSFAGLFLGLLRYGPIQWSMRFSRAVWPRHWNFIKWMSPSVLLETIQSNVPTFVCAAVLGDGAVGLLRSMQSLANIINLPFNALQQVAPSMAAASFAQNGARGLFNVLKSTTTWGLGVVLILTVLALLLSQQIIEVGFKLELADGLPIFLAFCAVNVMQVIRLPLAVYCQTLERPKISTFSELLGLSTALLVVAFLVSTLGVIVVPVSQFVALLAATLVFFVVIKPTPFFSATVR